MAGRMSCILSLLVVILFTNIPTSQARSVMDKKGQRDDPQKSADVLDLAPSEKRHITVHNSGDLYGSFEDGLFSRLGAGTVDPETGDFVEDFTYPRGSGKNHMWAGTMWVGAIVGEDTLVSVAYDLWVGGQEIVEEDYPDGSSYRTGNFADDEFVTTLVDTFAIGGYGNLTPIGLKITQTSYSWVDSLYDDFIIMEYRVENISDQLIQDAWIGFLMDGDLFHISDWGSGYIDDLSGVLDTMLYENDPLSQKLIPYIIDNDGDPESGPIWGETSITSGISMSVLGASFDISKQNFNWWVSDWTVQSDYGPRRMGDIGDPFRPFALDNLGTPVSDPDKYYILSHPEVDFDQVESAIHDSSDGWIPGSPLDMEYFADGFDAKFLLSFGEFDLAPGEAESFTVAIVAAGDIHTNPSDFSDLFDAANPEPFANSLDFSKLMTYHRRADSVYQSGLTLPIPGPPLGLAVESFSDEEVALLWNSTNRSDLDGYYLYYKDTLVDNSWHRSTPLPLIDATYTYAVPNPHHEYNFAVTIVSDVSGESLRSDSIAIYPARPTKISDLSATVGKDCLPYLRWTPPDAPAVNKYRIYRSIWNEEFSLFDSSSVNSFVDSYAESGIKYDYLVSAVNKWGHESETVGPVSAVPMAMNQGVLFFNYNSDTPNNLLAYNPEYTDRLYESLASSSSIQVHRRGLPNWYLNEEDFKEMADYELIIFDLESRNSSFHPYDNQYLQLYMESGGKAIFINLRAGNKYAPVNIIKINYEPGDFYHDILKLDSSVINPMIYDGPPLYIYGDLAGCQSESANYPQLVADTVKLRNCGTEGNDYIPMAGYMFPTEEAEILYRYQSSDLDTINHNQVNGIRYLGDDFQFVFFNFQLSLMEENASFNALHQAVYDLGINMNCGDANVDSRTNVGDIVFLIQHIYYSSPPELPAPINADVNCDGTANVGDAVTLINYVFKGGYLECCVK